MIRIFDGERWYYSAITDLKRIQEEIFALAALARPREDISEHPVVRRLKANRGVHLTAARMKLLNR